MKNWLEKHLFMSRKELRGLSFLTLVLLAFWSAPFAYRNLIFKPKITDLRAQEREIRAFLTSELPTGNHQAASPAKAFKGIPFDPNALTLEQGEQLGLSPRQIRMIQNYVAKGGRFREKEDLAKIYAISETDYQRLAPYIRLSDAAKESPQRRNPVAVGQAPEQTLFIELNTTDSLELQELRGIGPVFASRIIRFRDLLGGFYDKRQLLDVYGMDPERFKHMEKHVYADSTKITKIDINNADYATLSKHPWITSRQARLIINYREQHGSYRKGQDLLGIEVINEDFLRKIVPYLKFSDDD